MAVIKFFSVAWLYYWVEPYYGSLASLDGTEALSNIAYGAPFALPIELKGIAV